MIETPFGKANLNRGGYYVIVSHKEGNFQKLLHRLIFEDFYKINLDDEFPEGVVIHHEDGNKTNNKIWNLVPMDRSYHSAMHNKGKECVWKGKHLPKKMRENISKAKKGLIFTKEWRQRISEAKKGTKVSEETKKKFSELYAGENNPMYGKNHTLESRMKMSKSRKGKKLSEKHRESLSKQATTTGFYRVSKKKDITCTQGFIWIYTYHDENGKRHYFGSVDLLKLKKKVLNNKFPWEILNKEKAFQSIIQENQKYGLCIKEVSDYE